MTTALFFNPKSHAPAVYIPAWLIQVPANQLSHFAKLLYGRLAQWCNTSGVVHRSANQLAFELGAQTRVVERGIKELKDTNLIQTHRAKSGGVNHYRFLSHKWMSDKLHVNLEYPEKMDEVINNDIHNQAETENKTDLVPTKTSGEFRQKCRESSDKNVGPKIREYVLNKRATTKSVKSGNNFPPAKKSSSVLSYIDDKFMPDDESLKKLHETAEQKRIDTVVLQEKFIAVSQCYKTRSSDWQQTFREFLARERPSGVFTGFKERKSENRIGVPVEMKNVLKTLFNQF